MGPFVHIASIVATLLAKLTTFKGIYENESRRSEMLAAACAVGVAGTFAAPIGGVLFSIEVTATYFAVRNYWRGFFAAVCGALMFRLLSIWFKHEGNIHGRFIYPGLVALVISSITFPPGLGQFFAGEYFMFQLTARKAINELFSNITWTLGQADNLADEEVISHWKHPATNIYINLVIFTVMNFWMGALCNTLPVPAGVFVPVFTVGAGFGRLIGESMAAWFPEGITSENGVYKIVPGGYAVVGAASMSGAVTRTISTAVIVFELTGQISHVLPAVVSVLIANAVANQLQPSFYDSIIRLKKLPYLPDIVSSKSSTWKIFVEDIMVSDVKMIAFDSTYGDLKDLLTSTFHKTYPLVDTIDSRVLLGSIQRFELERLLLVNISHEQKITLPESPEYERSGRSSPASFVTASRSSTPPIKEEEDSEIPNKPISRFNVSKVEESEPVKPKPVRLSLPKPVGILSEPSMPTLDIDEETKEKQTYHTLQLPPRSILKNSTPQGRLEKKSHSETDLKKDINTFYRKLTDTRKESIVEDVPFYIDPPEPVKIKNLPSEKQQEWEAQKLMEDIDWEGCQIDPAPFQLVERTSLHKVHSLFSLLGLSHAYVTSAGKLIGVCGLKDLRLAIQGRIDEQGKSEPDKEETEDIDPSNLEIETPPFNPEFVLTEVPDTDDEEEKDQIEMNSVKVTKA
ncbi:hypothetical protein KUTeg_001883 [Tegillarca granosa]|uniref:Chloride channel protein n=1 Tax=Tegillarca granosa TaxID=220873 RepID=A0ABQ9FU62_TEGGR|nr:hypothetical protein KUTeg_001883 [Tegillarca granosa]